MLYHLQVSDKTEYNKMRESIKLYPLFYIRSNSLRLSNYIYYDISFVRLI